MKCINPVWIAKKQIYVPCGSCVHCKIQRTREWAVRIVHEASCHDSNLFVTLTYDDDHLPPGNSVDRKELQKYFKRIRKDLHPKKIKYFACGEYGEKYGRPHYHAIIFGLELKDVPMLEENWKKGFVKVGTVTYESARYVAKYLQKESESSIHLNRLSPFKLQSLGIGKEFALANRDQIEYYLAMTINGQDMSIPRYYVKVLDLADKVAKAPRGGAKRTRSHALEITHILPDDVIRRYQREKILKARAEISKDNNTRGL